MTERTQKEFLVLLIINSAASLLILILYVIELTDVASDNMLSNRLFLHVVILSLGILNWVLLKDWTENLICALPFAGINMICLVIANLMNYHILHNLVFIPILFLVAFSFITLVPVFYKYKKQQKQSSKFKILRTAQLVIFLILLNTIAIPTVLIFHNDGKLLLLLPILSQIIVIGTIAINAIMLKRLYVFLPISILQPLSFFIFPLTTSPNSRSVVYFIYYTSPSTDFILHTTVSLITIAVFTIIKARANHKLHTQCIKFDR